MKFSKWTLGLAAVGAVSLASAVRADEAKMSQLNTALSNTTISGVVDVGYSQQLGDVGPSASLPSYGVGTDSRFSLNQVIISLDKPLDEGAWASGYHIDLNWGDKAVNGTIRQAYVALRTPVGNGIDWKVGVFDGVTGYEGNTLSANPNYTRSFGWQVNPASFTGAIGSYKISDLISVQAGVANRSDAWSAFGQSSAKRQSKDYIATASFTAPESFGFLKGATLNLQTVQGFDNQSIANYSANVTLPLPVTGLKAGLSYDAVNNTGGVVGLLDQKDLQVFGAFASYQATDKLNLSLRGEILKLDSFVNGEEVTATLAYNLWANVISRLEVRWDFGDEGQYFSATESGVPDSRRNSVLIAANVIYKF